MNSDEQGHHELSGKSNENKSFKPNQKAPSIYIMVELCFFSLNQWEIKIHLLWGECFNIPHWPRSHSTNRRLQHIEKVSKTYSGDPHLGQTKLNGLLLLTIHGVLSGHQGGIECANRRTGKDLINPKTPKTPNICCFVVKLHLSWFTRFFRGNIPILW